MGNGNSEKSKFGLSSHSLENFDKTQTFLRILLGMATGITGDKASAEN
jgi:hypothetical protein